MRVLLLLSLSLTLAACSYAPKYQMPYRIDVQQGNALEQESVEKLKLGLSRSQVRFLLGTPLLVDPFHNNRWDYVYNYRKAGKLTEERRLVLFFDGDSLVRIESEGFPPKGEVPAPKPGSDAPVAPKPNAAAEPAAVKPAAAATPAPAPEPVAVVETPKPVEKPQPKPVVETAPANVQTVRPQTATTGQNSLEKTSIVAPLQSDEPKPDAAAGKPAAPNAATSEPVALQVESNVSAIRTDAMPDVAGASSAPVPAEEQIGNALKSWADAWRSRNEEAYFAAYAPNFKPEGGESRDEWEKRRRLLLGVTRNIDLRIDGVTTEIVTEDRAHVSFRQFYRSESYQDAVIKQLKFVRVDNLWLIEEERVLAPIKVKK